MNLFYRIAADCVVVIHAAYAGFIVVGFVLILIGAWWKWNWVRSFWFRAIHLTMILFVVLEAWIGMTCPLTTWEKDLRRLAGEDTYQGDFLANAVHDLLFFEAPPWVFTVIYSLVGLTILLTFIMAPPRRPRFGRRTST